MNGSLMKLPKQGRAVDQVIADLVQKRQHDLKWSEGRGRGRHADGRATNYATLE
jgi:hypothetical protein